MRNPGHYGNKLTHPPEGSRDEFYVYAFSLLTHYPPWPVHYDPVPVPEGLSTGDRQVWEMRNREAEDNAESWQYIAREELRMEGFEPRELDAPRMQFVIRHLALQKRSWASMGVEAQDAPAPLVAPYDKRICQKVIFLASHSLGHRPLRLTSVLNEGRSNRSKSKISTDHVMRAKKAFLDACAASTRYKRLGFAAFDLDFAHWSRTFAALEYVRQIAESRPDLRNLKGAELARAIDHRHSLPASVKKAEAVPAIERRFRSLMQVWIGNNFATGAK